MKIQKRQCKPQHEDFKNMLIRDLAHEIKTVAKVMKKAAYKCHLLGN